MFGRFTSPHLKHVARTELVIAWTRRAKHRARTELTK